MPVGLYTAEDHAARYDAARYDRLNNPSIQPSNYSYDLGNSQTWNPAGTFGGLGGGNSISPFGATGRMKTSAVRQPRAALPSTWLDSHSPLQSLHQFAGLGNATISQSQLRPEPLSAETDEELIPTAIVIKNIPFAVKKEQLVGLMTDMSLPLPYAFNYHFDNGVFRGLAFANFTTAEETAAVIDVLNHFELQGRKLRVEYKKMLPLAERERIEREKRERRGQLEEQHRPMAASQLHNQPSLSSLSSAVAVSSPSPVSARNAKPGNTLYNLRRGFNFSFQSPDASTDVDLNDPQTLQFYSQLLLFRDDLTREALIFPPTLSPPQRRIVHTLAHHMALAHVSRGNGEQRQVHVFRAPPGANNMSPPLPQISTAMPGDSHRRGLNRAATVDFSDTRGSDAGPLGNVGRQSSGLLDIPGSPATHGIIAGQNLRAAKSFADLRSYTPSPVPSSASFPASLGAGISRYNEYGPGSGASATPTLTPTGNGSGMMSSREESLLSNGLGSMSLGGSLGVGGVISRDGRTMHLMDSQHAVGGPIGSNRNFGLAFDDPSRGRAPVPHRQPRGPVPERGSGFRPRPNGRPDSDDLDVGSSREIIVE
ncbi:MAG: hypothetical protein M1829_001216 [Trizodia sp. TS-e1964]|nr:MAG: hypothetical protein M1829_001216 [Trizodia sp. TS-e1964]